MAELRKKCELAEQNVAFWKRFGEMWQKTAYDIGERWNEEPLAHQMKRLEADGWFYKQQFRKLSRRYALLMEHVGHVEWLESQIATKDDTESVKVTQSEHDTYEPEYL